MKSNRKTNKIKNIPFQVAKIGSASIAIVALSSSIFTIVNSQSNGGNRSLQSFANGDVNLLQDEFITYNDEFVDPNTGEAVETLSNGSVSVDQNSLLVDQVKTQGGLQNFGIINAFEIQGLRSNNFQTAVSEIRVVDIYGNTIPYKIDTDWTPEIAHLQPSGTTYTNNLTNYDEYDQDELDNNLRQAEEALQDNDYVQEVLAEVSSINTGDSAIPISSFNDDNLDNNYQSILDEYGIEIAEQHRPSDLYNFEGYSSVSVAQGYDWLSSKGADKGLDLRLVLNTPTIISHIEFSMFFDQQEGTIDKLTIEQSTGDKFYCEDLDLENSFGTDDSISIVGNSLVRDYWSSYYFGGAYDSREYTWKSYRYDGGQTTIGGNANWFDGYYSRLVSYDSAPDGYMTLFVKSNSNLLTGSTLTKIPTEDELEVNNASYGTITLTDQDQSNGINLYVFFVSKAFNIKDDSSVGVIIDGKIGAISPSNSLTSVPAQTLSGISSFSFSQSNLDTNPIVGSQKVIDQNGEIVYSNFIDWSLLDIPVINNELQIRAVIKYQKNNSESGNVGQYVSFSNYNEEIYVDLSQVTRTQLNLDTNTLVTIELFYVDGYTNSSSTTDQTYFSQTYRVPNFTNDYVINPTNDNFPSSSLHIVGNGFTNGNLETLGSISDLDLTLQIGNELLAPENQDGIAYLSELQFLDAQNRPIDYSITYYSEDEETFSNSDFTRLEYIRMTTILSDNDTFLDSYYNPFYDIFGNYPIQPVDPFTPNGDQSRYFGRYPIDVGNFSRGDEIKISVSFSTPTPVNRIVVNGGSEEIYDSLWLSEAVATNSDNDVYQFVVEPTSSNAFFGTTSDGAPIISTIEDSNDTNLVKGNENYFSIIGDSSSGPLLPGGSEFNINEALNEITYGISPMRWIKKSSSTSSNTSFNDVTNVVSGTVGFWNQVPDSQDEDIINQYDQDISSFVIYDTNGIAIPYEVTSVEFLDGFPGNSSSYERNNLETILQDDNLETRTPLGNWGTYTVNDGGIFDFYKSSKYSPPLSIEWRFADGQEHEIGWIEYSYKGVDSTPYGYYEDNQRVEGRRLDLSFITSDNSVYESLFVTGTDLNGNQQDFQGEANAESNVHTSYFGINNFSLDQIVNNIESKLAFFPTGFGADLIQNYEVQVFDGSGSLVSIDSFIPNSNLTQVTVRVSYNGSQDENLLLDGRSFVDFIYEFPNFVSRFINVDEINWPDQDGEATFSGINNFGEINLTNIQAVIGENIDIRFVVNEGTNSQEVYLNQSPSNLSNGDTINVYYAPQTGYSFSSAAQEYTGLFNVSGLSDPIVASPLPSSSNVAISLSGSNAHGEATITIIGLDTNQFDYQVRILRSSSNTTDTLDSSQLIQNLRNGDIVYIDLLSINGYLINEFGSQISESFAEFSVDGLVQSVDIATPTLPSDISFSSSSTSAEISINLSSLDSITNLDENQNTIYYSYRQAGDSFLTISRTTNLNDIMDIALTTNNFGDQFIVEVESNDGFLYTDGQQIGLSSSQSISATYTLASGNTVQTVSAQVVPYNTDYFPNSLSIFGEDGSAYIQFTNDSLSDWYTAASFYDLNFSFYFFNDSQIVPDLNDLTTIQTDAVFRSENVDPYSTNLTLNNGFPLSNNFKVVAIATLKAGFEWADNVDSSQYLAKEYVISNLSSYSATEAPTINFELVGINGNNFTQSGLINSNYLLNNPNVTANAFIFKRDEIMPNTPTIIREFNSNQYNSYDPSSRNGNLIDPTLVISNLESGDRIVLLIQAEEGKLLWNDYNFFTKVINVDNLAVSVRRPVVPTFANKEVYIYGVNGGWENADETRRQALIDATGTGASSFNDDLSEFAQPDINIVDIASDVFESRILDSFFSVDTRYNNFTIIHTTSITGTSVTTTYSVNDGDLTNLDGTVNLSLLTGLINGDVLQFEISAKEGYWWGDDINDDPSTFSYSETVVVDHLPEFKIGSFNPFGLRWSNPFVTNSNNFSVASVDGFEGDATITLNMAIGGANPLAGWRAGQWTVGGIAIYTPEGDIKAIYTVSSDDITESIFEGTDWPLLITQVDNVDYENGDQLGFFFTPTKDYWFRLVDQQGGLWADLYNADGNGLGGADIRNADGTIDFTNTANWITGASIHFNPTFKPNLPEQPLPSLVWEHSPYPRNPIQSINGNDGSGRVSLVSWRDNWEEDFDPAFTFYQVLPSGATSRITINSEAELLAYNFSNGDRIFWTTFGNASQNYYLSRNENSAETYSDELEVQYLRQVVNRQSLEQELSQSFGQISSVVNASGATGAITLEVSQLLNDTLVADQRVTTFLQVFDPNNPAFTYNVELIDQASITDNSVTFDNNIYYYRLPSSIDFNPSVQLVFIAKSSQTESYIFDDDSSTYISTNSINGFSNLNNPIESSEISYEFDQSQWRVGSSSFSIQFNDDYEALNLETIQSLFGHTNIRFVWTDSNGIDQQISLAAQVDSIIYSYDAVANVATFSNVSLPEPNISLSIELDLNISSSNSMLIEQEIISGVQYNKVIINPSNANLSTLNLGATDINFAFNEEQPISITGFNFISQNPVSGSAQFDLTTMGIVQGGFPNQRFDISVTRNNVETIYRNVGEESVGPADLQIGDIVVISSSIIDEDGVFNYAFLNVSNNSPTLRVVLFEKTLDIEDGLRIYADVDSAQSFVINYFGVDGGAYASNLADITIANTNVSFTYNYLDPTKDSVTFTNIGDAPRDLSDGDSITVNYDPLNSDSFLISGGMPTQETVGFTFVVSNLRIPLNFPRPTFETITYVGQRTNFALIDINFDSLFSQLQLDNVDLQINVYQTSNDQSPLIASTTNQLLANYQTDSTILEALNISLNNRVEYIFTAKDGYSFSEGAINRQVYTYEDLVTSFSKNPILVSSDELPTSLLYQENTEVDGFALISLDFYDIPSLNNRNINVEFIITKGDGSEEMFTNSYPTTILSNGDRIQITLTPNFPSSDFLRIGSFDYENEYIEQYVVTNLPIPINGVAWVDELQFQGYTDEGLFVSPILLDLDGELQSYNVMYEIRRNGETDFENPITSSPSDLQNGDEIRISITPFSGTALLNNDISQRDTEPIVDSYTSEIYTVSGLLILAEVGQIPDGFVLVENSDGNYVVDISGLLELNEVVTLGNVNIGYNYQYELNETVIDVINAEFIDISHVTNGGFIVGNSATINITPITSQYVLNRNDETLITRTFDIPTFDPFGISNLRDEFLIFNEENLNYTIDLDFIAEIRPENVQIEYLLPENSATETWSTTPPESLSSNQRVLIRIVPTDGFGYVNDPNQSTTFGITTPEISVIPLVEFPDRLFFTGISGDGIIDENNDQYLALLERSDIVITYSVNGASISGRPTELSNNDVVTITVVPTLGKILPNGIQSSSQDYIVNNLFLPENPIIVPLVAAASAVVVLIGVTTVILIFRKRLVLR